MEISVCIVTARRPAALHACLTSLRGQVDAPPFEVVVLSNDDAAVVDTVAAAYPDAVVGVVSRHHPGAARNHLVDKAVGSIVLFLDDDVVVDPTLLRRLATVAAAHPEASVFGGPNVTPAGSTTFELVQGAVLSSIFGTGPVRRRYGPHPAGEADEQWFTLCNLAFRRSSMVRFADDLVCAEENAVLAEMSRAGARMVYDPELRAYHERRPDLRSFASQMGKYGRGRGQLLRRDPRTVRVAYLVPSALLVYVALLPAAATATPLALLPLGAYAAGVALTSLKVRASVRRRRSGSTAAILIAVMHGCYGWGVLRGLVLRGRRARAAVPQWTAAPPR